MNKIKRTFTYANLMASFAVFLALGGAAYAVDQAQRNSVTSPSIKNGTVTAKDVKNASLTGKDVKDDALKGVDIDEASLALPGGNANTAPTGPAGGDLTGSYPNPLIGPNAVETNEIATGGVTNTDIGQAAVTGIKLGLSSVDSSKIQDEAVGSAEIGPAAVGISELAADTVGAAAFKNMNTVTSQGVAVNAGTPQNVSVSCPAGRQLVSGGYAWQDDEANSIIRNIPSETDPNRTWQVRGMVDAGSNTLFAWANCLQA